MQSILKSENKILINGADSSEKILIENLVNKANLEGSKTTFESVLDINGDITGCLITVIESTPIDNNTENTENTEDTNTNETNTEETNTNENNNVGN